MYSSNKSKNLLFKILQATIFSYEGVQVQEESTAKAYGIDKEVGIVGKSLSDALYKKILKMRGVNQ